MVDHIEFGTIKQSEQNCGLANQQPESAKKTQRSHGSVTGVRNAYLQAEGHGMQSTYPANIAVCFQTWKRLL